MSLSNVRSAMSEYATGFDPDRVSAADAARIVEDAAAIKNMAATVEALAAARVAETELWKRDGDRSAAHQLARTTGTSIVKPKGRSRRRSGSGICRRRRRRRGGASCRPSRWR
jgi:hypothetical protein